MDKRNVVCPYKKMLFEKKKKKMLFGQKKEWSTNTCYSLDEPWKPYAKWKKPVTYYMIPFIWKFK